MERTGVGGTLSHACHPTGRGVGNTAAPCRDQTGGPDAPRGRGKRHITDEATLVEAIDLVLKEYRVAVAQRDMGKAGRADHPIRRPRARLCESRARAQKTRYHITHIARQADPIAALSQRLGWKAFVTNAGQKRLSLQEAVLCSRHAYRVERLCNRLKSRVHIAPLFVKLNEPMEGLTYLLTLGVRVLTVTECVLRRSLEQDQVRLSGLPSEQAQEDRQAYGGADPENVDGYFADDHQACRRRGHPAPPDALVKITGGHPATAGVGCCSLGRLEIQAMGN